MKKLLALIVVLGMASAAQAGFLISVNGVVDPADSTVSAAPSDIITIGLHGVDNTANNTDIVLLSAGNLDFSNMTFEQAGSLNGIFVFSVGDLAGSGYTSGAQITLADGSALPPSQLGLLVDNITIHIDGLPGEDVVIDLVDGGFNLLDSQVIHITPEPMTMSLLALGGLGLIRRRRA